MGRASHWHRGHSEGVVILLLLLALLQDGGQPTSLLGLSVPDAIGTSSGRRYHQVPLAQMATTKRTHVETCGRVVYVRKMQDGDWHVTMADGAARVVVEVIPLLSLPVPRKGHTIRVRGISRCDLWHGRYEHGRCTWIEIHPAESIEVVASCH